MRVSSESRVWLSLRSFLELSGALCASNNRCGFSEQTALATWPPWPRKKQVESHRPFPCPRPFQALTDCQSGMIHGRGMAARSHPAGTYYAICDISSMFLHQGLIDLFPASANRCLKMLFGWDSHISSALSDGFLVLPLATAAAPPRHKPYACAFPSAVWPTRGHELLQDSYSEGEWVSKSGGKCSDSHFYTSICHRGCLHRAYFSPNHLDARLR
ncbi:hypothetical protein BD289DRAFT_223775 [Coniella lustricola]|uniref:Uncharacterized protein n=1 Tax=Coniella lustricola TaxID=2025994 RepID=A0A2T3AAV9_9PEZI|nr:hypothetical protein BD289DRAFT_223775 [Coniella lustricola]